MTLAKIDTARRQALAPVRGEGPAEVVARRLGEAIGSGVFAPGEQLPPEAELAAMLDVAPMTLRSATAALRDAGLLETRRGRGGGTFVASDPRQVAAPDVPDLSSWALREMTVWRRAVSGEIAAQAASLANEGDRDRIVAGARAVDAATADREKFRLADSRFHLVLAEVAASERLMAAEVAIQADLSRVLKDVPTPKSAARLSAAGHDPIVEAIARADPTGARASMERHVEATYDWIASYRLGFA